MIGAFYQPKLVFADVSALRTLPSRELGCGLAETVKHSVIRDAEFFDMLEAKAADIRKLSDDSLVELVVRNCGIKASVVAADERESGLRGILNFGHTIGHTFETVMKDRDYHHGEAVSLGMVAAIRIAVSRGMVSEGQGQRVIALLGELELPVSIEGELPVDLLCKAMMQDKKVKAGKIVFVLPTGIGSCKFVNDLSEEEIKVAIESLGA